MPIKTRYFKSNRFSEGHRVLLPSNYCLFDVDGILLDDDGNLGYIYEGKYKMYSKNNGDFIKKFYDPKNRQAFYLRLVSEKIGVYIHEQKTDKWWFINDRRLEECENPRMNLLKTENRIYIEDIFNGYSQKLSGIFLRTEGEKPCSLMSQTQEISEILGIPVILVNDTHKEDRIYFKRDEKILGVQNTYRWEDLWKELDIDKTRNPLT